MTTQTTPAHTPGHWSINAADGRTSVVAQYANHFATTQPVAVMTGVNREANARLIAAAPALLAALEDLARQVFAFACMRPDLSENSPGFRDLHEAARAALALAKGDA